MTKQHPIAAGDAMTRLDADRRSRDLLQLQGSGASVDVLVVGGGITGTGVALDAASRGLKVALVERNDLAYGTSRWSSKLIHGGLRYLAKGDVGIAWESAVERAAIGSHIAPHLVRPLTQIVLLRKGEDLARVGTRLGLYAADALRVAARTEKGLLARSAPVDVEALHELVPALDTDDLSGGVAIADLQMEDDARFVTAVARTAAGYGARILTRVDALEVAGDRVRLRDNETGQDWWLGATRIVNATGVWAGELDPNVVLSPSRGTHLVLRSSSLSDASVSLSVPVPESFGRYVFTLPQPDGLTYVGITDEPVEGPIPEEPSAPEADIEWILSVLNTALREPVTRQDVVGTFAGLRPLVAGSDAASADLSRRHAIVEHDRLITVTGGKFTAYRRMAQDVVDLITERPCRTRTLPLVGAGDSPAADLPHRLVRRYGSEAALVWAMGADDPSLRQPLAPGLPVLGVEVAFAAAWEGAATTSDVLDRRTRLGLVPSDAAAARDAVDRIVEQWQRGKAYAATG